VTVAQSASAPDNARCPRCGGPFRCGAADATPCACASLTLSPALLADLGLGYSGCLCLDCLRTLAAAAAPRPGR
jgi:hypothetical protein